jgi:2-polyprenyl-6-hydroxyphenyl methylase/3-demethylubiquinone-9 3-methyltransferase
MFDGWTQTDFLRNIYNSDYVVVDPDYIERRPASNAQWVADLFCDSTSTIRVLDYGGGSGRFAEILRGRGFDAQTYDPFSEHGVLPGGRFNLITSFEVMEHSSRPRDVVRMLAGLLADEGMIVLSTLVQPRDFDGVGLNWWYVGPRNGHISIFSQRSLVGLFAAHGLKLASLSDNLHLAFRSLPAFAPNALTGAVT